MSDKTEGKAGDPEYFACHCSEEGKKECNELLEKVYGLLDANASNLLTKVVYSLEWDYMAKITSIDCDMWSAISSKTRDMTPDLKEQDPPLFTTYIQCDDLEHGVAATWLAYYEKFGKKRVDR
jgi:hypothetical protein